VLALQEQRRRQGLEPLAATALASRLGCDPRRIEEAVGLNANRAVRSLDAPLGGGGADGECPGSLLDLLAAPDGPPAEPAPETDALAAERAWLREQFEALDPQQRELLVGRLQVGCTWVELGRKLGLPARQAQRRCDAALDRLRRAALAWRQQRDPDPSMG
jgi:RNA polymerase sigma-B factor